MTYRLTYWNKRGRGEQVRLLLADLEQPWEDVSTGGEAFAELQKEGPSVLYFGSVPMLDDDGFRLCQAPAILGYLARKHGIAPTNPQQAARAEATVRHRRLEAPLACVVRGPARAQRQQRVVRR